MKLTWLMVGFWLSVGTILVLQPVLAKSSEPDGGLVRRSIWLALACYFLAAILLSGLQRDDWSAGTTHGRLARCAWSVAWMMYLLHVVLAFHFFHQWSHAHAIDHTRKISGFGGGIYFSHAFGLLWGLDVAWWWLAPRAYASRSRWFDGLLHGYMTFIIFNGAVVFAAGLIRPWAGGMYAVVAGMMVWRWTRQRQGFRQGVNP